MLAEDHGLRASLPPRAEERQRRERHRANRAVFVALFVALIALLVVAFVIIRPGQTDTAKAVDNGQGPDAESSTTASGEADGTRTTGSAGSTTAPAYGAGQPAPYRRIGGGWRRHRSRPGRRDCAGGGPATTTPTNVTPSSGGPPPSGPLATSPTTCTAQVVNPAPSGPANRLPKAASNGTPSYVMRVTLSSSIPPSSSVALVRRSPTSHPPPAEAWGKPISGSNRTIDVGPFVMKQGSGPTTGQGVITHEELPGASFDLQLRFDGRFIGCGAFLGPE